MAEASKGKLEKTQKLYILVVVLKEGLYQV